MTDVSRIPLHLVWIVVLSLVFTGCYTQFGAMDQQSGHHAADDPTPASTESQDYATEEDRSAREVDGRTYRTEEIAYARRAYEARQRGEISFAQYRDILLELHYEDPFNFLLDASLFHDPLFSPMISPARFSAAITFRTIGGFTRQPTGLSSAFMRSIYSPVPIWHYNINRPLLAGYSFTHVGRHGYAPYVGRTSSLLQRERLATQGRLSSVSATVTDGRVGTQGRVASDETATASSRNASSSSSGMRQDTAVRSVDRDLRSRTPERLEAPERRTAERRSATSTARERGNARTTRDRGDRSRDRGTSTRTRGSDDTRTSSGSSTSSDRGSSSRGSSSRGGGNN